MRDAAFAILRYLDTCPDGFTLEQGATALGVPLDAAEQALQWLAMLEYVMIQGSGAFAITALGRLKVATLAKPGHVPR